jgi:hypothetical protein
MCAPTNSSLHECTNVLTTGEFKDWDGKTPFVEKPLFYQGVSDETGKLMVEISDECMAIKERLHKDYPALDLSYVVPTQDWVLGAYGKIHQPYIYIYTSMYHIHMSALSFR